VGFGWVVTAGIMNSSIFWDVMLWSLAKIYCGPWRWKFLWKFLTNCPVSHTIRQHLPQY